MSPFVVAASSEVNFFDVDANFDRGLDWYRAQMPLSYSNQVTVERNPMYFWSFRAVNEIYKMNKTVRLILVIEDPVSMVASRATRLQTNMSSVYLTTERGKVKVNDESRTIDWGIYIKYIRGWLAKFPRKQIHVVETLDLKKQPAEEMMKLEKFLDIPPSITERNFYFNTTLGNYCLQPSYPQTQVKCLSPDNHERIVEELPKKERKLLYAFYEKHNEELFSLLDRRFDWKH